MIERIYYCDAPPNPMHADDEPDATRCLTHATTSRTHAPVGWLTVTEWNTADGGDGHVEMSFCGWDCLLRYAATFDPPEVIQ